MADQIVKVYLKDGKEKWLLIHIEVQGDDDPDFSKECFVIIIESLISTTVMLWQSHY
ncbi:hypothetical protein ACI2OX_09010 [Bacillus sp. N9]